MSNYIFLTESFYDVIDHEIWVFDKPNELLKFALFEISQFQYHTEEIIEHEIYWFCDLLYIKK